MPNAIAQETPWSNLRCKTVVWDTVQFPIDSLSIDESSIRLFSTERDSSPLPFSYSLATNFFQFLPTENPPDSVTVCYRVFPFLFSKTVALRTQSQADTGLFFELPNRQEELKRIQLQQEGILKASGLENLTEGTDLERNGSLTRGISFGSAQDVFVNSALNLQLSGNLTDDITIEANLSDQQIPYQPEGNTQQLQEFDRVYISLKHKKGNLDAGDITLENQPSHFLRYYKNVQGGQLSFNLGDSAKFYAESRVGVAVAKGQFVSQNLQPIEGVAGPYRLTGPRNERFIVVMANSEQVFIDGELMERGFNRDYIIDYNTAEITFTNRVLITQFTRIRVDFEYAVQNYARTILQADQTLKYKKWESSFHFYQEKDNRNSPLLFELSDEDKRLLAAVGDSLENASAPTATEVEEFTPNQVLYTQRDTVVNGVTSQIFIRARQGDSPLFRVVFSEAEGGEYAATTPEANGRVFAWRGVNNQGFERRFAPIRILPAPNKRSMLVGKLNYKASAYTSIFTELALSDHDQNLYSTQNNEDNQGVAALVGIQVKNKPLKKWENSKINSLLSYEHNQQYFRPIDRFRYVEFDRDWSVTDTFPAIDQILTAQVQVARDIKNSLFYKAVLRHRENAARGIQQTLNFAKREKWFQVNTQAFSMISETPQNQATWYRFKNDISYPGEKIVPGYIYQVDRNRVARLATDSVVSSAMNFEAHQWYIQNADSLPIQFKLSYETRADRSPLQGELQAFTQANTLDLSLSHEKKKQQIALFFTYRTLEQQQLEGTPVEETITGRLDWRSAFLKNAVQSELSFLTNAGRELRREFVYLAVDPGTGTHAWRDENEDGVQQLGEFYEAINPDERNFAKFFTPTNEYVPAFNTQVVHRLRLAAPASWIREEGFRKLISRFSYTSSLRFQQKSTQSSLKVRIAPFLFSIADSSLLGKNVQWRSQLFYNKRSPRFGIELSNDYSQRRQLLTNGFENNSAWEHLLAVRYTARKTTTLRLEFTNQLERSISPLLNNRDIDVQSLGIEPQLIILFSRAFRLNTNLSYTYKEDRNGSEVGNDARLISAGGQVRWNQGVKSLLSADFTFTQANYEGDVNSARGYTLLEALQPGSNYQWRVNWTKQLKGGLQLTLSYTGRKPEGIPVIHLGRMQATALF